MKHDTKISKRTLYLLGMAFTFASFLEPGFFGYFENRVDDVYAVLRKLSLIFVAYVFFKDGVKRIRHLPITITVVIYSFLYFLATVLAKGDYLELIKEAIWVCSFVFFVECCYVTKKEDFLKICIIVLTVLSVLNLLSMLFFAEGLTGDFYEKEKVFLLGHKNMVTYYPMLLLLCVEKVSVRNQGLYSVFEVIVAGMTLATAFLAGSSTSTVMAIIISLSLILYRVVCIKKVPLFSLILVGFALVCSVLITSFGIQKYFEELIVFFFHKDASFTGRVETWQKAMEYIRERPIFGYGREDGALVLKKLAYNMHAHNTILSCLYRCGVGGLLVYLAQLFFVLKGILRSNKKKAVFFSVFLFAVLIGNIFSAKDYDKIVLMMYTVLAENCISTDASLSEGTYCNKGWNIK